LGLQFYFVGEILAPHPMSLPAVLSRRRRPDPDRDRRHALTDFLSLQLVAAICQAGPAGAEATQLAMARPADAPSRWIRLPDAEALFTAYPKEALRGGVGGKVRLSCFLGHDGKVRDCGVKEEIPADKGFAAAALSLAAGFELAPPIRGGQPVSDARVTIPVVFKPPANLARPNWRRIPNGNEMRAVYPAEPLRRGQGGKAIIECLVGANGALGACRLVNETPTGQGFGDAALALTPSFLMSPMTVDGQPVEGGVVRIPIIFNSDGPQMVEEQNKRLYRTMIWDQQPSRAEIADAFHAGTGGKGPGEEATVVMRCHLGADGELVGCAPLNVAGSTRYGAAVNRLIGRFRARLDPTTGPKRHDMVDVAFHLWPGTPTDAAAAALPPLETVEMTILNGPTEADLALPEPARTSGLTSAWAEVECAVATTGRLGDCHTVTEQAPGLQVDTATMRVAEKVRIATWNSLGEPTTGRHVRLRLELKAQTKPPTADGVR
jgi:TonB family protein